MNFKRSLVLAPHTDDGEFGCGATISRLGANGCEVFYAAFSACRQSVLKQFPEDILITEGQIGDGATVGMGAVVTKVVEENATVAGNPARTTESLKKINYFLSKQTELKK